ncbi:hypothetical protein BFL28_07970 [Sphingomonas turrisvirgatae]|uniref:Prolyl 4-hydroxylase alpha subunit Fe(2+) 2OG dioxygenase domain-containing protein n=1 Tax=Sphingomonas turrisvirgatae TaxID=1888892 RepID=A0A1E3LQR4_9SPHN|nr:hypothetical protein BFL28_07970 [Sphingomonas turrisvirgatae]
MPPSFIMIDDFLANPLELRRQALALGYDATAKAAGANYPGTVSSRALPISGLDEHVSRLAGVSLGGAAGTLHGHCRLTLKGEAGQSGVHIDPAYYSGILSLTPPAHCRGGTDFYRHRRTGLDAVPRSGDGVAAAGYGDHNALIEDVVNRDTRQPSRWEKSFTAPMRFNRLILFSPWLFHNSAPGFGSGPDDGRLVYLMFFAARS